MKGFWNRLKLFTRLQKGPCINDIHSPEKLRAILERERIRADRVSLQLSLVVFNLINTNSSSDGAEELKSVLCRRIRITDEVGWFDEKSIGTILPDTTPEGAWRFAEDICCRVTNIAKHLDCMVYTYPTKWLPDENEYFEQLKLPGIFHELDKAMFQNLPTYNDSTSDGNTTSVVSIPTTKIQVSMRPVQSLESLLIRSLPVWKRTMDIIIAIFGLLACTPIMLVTAIAIKLTSKGPILFKQERTAQGLQRFTMYKFRTMVNGADKELFRVRHLNEMTGPLIKIDRDPRLTKVGSFLRKTSIDELPQIFNVLKGDMTIIGPRALSPLPSEYESWQLRRFAVKPGIACTWQAQRRAERDFRKWMRCDLRYMDSASFWADMRVFFKTVLKVVGMNGAR